MNTVRILKEFKIQKGTNQNEEYNNWNLKKKNTQKGIISKLDDTEEWIQLGQLANKRKCSWHYEFHYHIGKFFCLEAVLAQFHQKQILS